MTTSISSREFRIKVLGRTLEHLGVQMYKRRDIALAELVANAWDAGANEVAITIPLPASYEQNSSKIAIRDNGSGMTDDEVQNAYLVIGRNRRSTTGLGASRRIMGRKGVGKLAGFGIGKRMTVSTWRDGVATEFTLNSDELRADDGDTAEHKIDGRLEAHSGSDSGSIITLRDLKHKTPLDIPALHNSLARRFSRTVTGEMHITINGEQLRAPAFELDLRWPSTEETADNRETLDDGNDISWWAGFSDKVLPTELQGFTILVNGKTAQAPAFFFGVESSASGQHGTKYLTGVIEADFLDAGVDDESDRISTDRQEIDWDDEATAALRTWGAAKTRELLTERVKARGKTVEDLIMKDSDLADRVSKLDRASERRAREFIRKLGWSETDHEKLLNLADTIVRAFEYRQFHDYIDELGKVADEEPFQFGEMVAHMHGWKVLESRAILEVVRGRVEILDKFHSLILSDAPETAPKTGADSLHDLIAAFPWLVNPEWQVYSEEKTISKQLREWGDTHTAPEDRTRYDFLALRSDREYVVIEIKRGSHAATLDDLQQLERYVDTLGQSHENVTGLFISGSGYRMSESVYEGWQKRPGIDITRWSQVYERGKTYYHHYKAVLNGEVDSDDFDRKSREVARTRGVLAEGTYRGPDQRAEGLGEQDAGFAVRDDGSPANGENPGP